jgi:hypothetical protein
MLTHGLLPEEKLEKVRSQVGLSAAAASQAPTGGDAGASELETGGTSRGGDDSRAGGDSRAGTGPSAESLSARVDRLESELAEVRNRLAELERALGGT